MSKQRSRRLSSPHPTIILSNMTPHPVMVSAQGVHVAQLLSGKELPGLDQRTEYTVMLASAFLSVEEDPPTVRFRADPHKNISVVAGMTLTCRNLVWELRLA